MTTQGATAGEWQSTDIGVTPNPAPPLYALISDGAENAVIPHPDPDALQQTEWQEWAISMTDITGVALNKVAGISIRVGNGSSPSGQGLVYIDDIWVLCGTEQTRHTRATPGARYTRNGHIFPSSLFMPMWPALPRRLRGLKGAGTSVVSLSSLSSCGLSCKCNSDPSNTDKPTNIVYFDENCALRIDTDVIVGRDDQPRPLDVHGNVAIKGTPVIDENGQWVGDPDRLARSDARPQLGWHATAVPEHRRRLGKSREPPGRERRHR